ncbi:MAG: phosphoribosylglycinamide formyltransferase, partial [Treponema sp.]|nr:phosphoribosylglycinamide formyltransferase [Treponema sp.]
MKKKVGVLVSGGGTNLQALIDFETKNADCPYEIVLVLSDHKDAYALERAKNAGIESRIVSPYAVMGAEVAKASDRDTKRLAVSNKILEYCKEFGVEIIVE